MIVGLTGGIGSGKSTIANFFVKQENVAVFVADVEAKKLMHTSKTIKNKLIQLFGENAYTSGKLNREYLSTVVFSDKQKLQQLNNIVHPAVRAHLEEFIKNNQKKSYIVYEAAILFESGNADFCDYIITVYTDETTRLQRVMQRDNVSEKEVRNRMKNQWAEDKKLLQSNYIIKNYDLIETEQQVRKIHNILTLKP